MGFFGDLAMGLGLKDRDADYYERTAKTLGRTQGADREALYRQSSTFAEQPARGGPVAMLGAGRGRRQWLSEEGVPEDTGKWGYTDASGERVSALRDMLDGGGRGRAGQRFEGGLLADLANALGFRPMGYEERLAAARPMARPTRAAALAAPDTSIRPQARRRPVAMGDWGAPVNIPPRPVAMGDWGLPVNMPTAPQGMFTSPLSIGSGNFPIAGGIYASYLTGPDYTSRFRPSTLPVVTPTGGMPWVHNPLTPSTSNIFGTGTGGGGYGFPAAGTYTF